ncbi:MAG: hypothetical protein N3I35_13765 [Clostridia bacterium]|nr:hypothetical protein [Clostridia bacterium]
MARNGCGDFYGPPITDTGVKDEIFFGDHEIEELIFMAKDLKEIIKKYCNDEL